MIIVSLATIPCRKEILKQNLNFVLKQTLKYDKLVINLDNNLSFNDYRFYDELAKEDARIEINKSCEAKWKSANKLIPVLKKYPDAVIITIDDDMSYLKTALEDLYNAWQKNKECIISHEVNPVIWKEGKLCYENILDLKLNQIQCGKYLTNCCLFPPHVFDSTDVFNYDLMQKLTGGTHDELWFWENTFLKGVKCIGLDKTMSLTMDSKYKHNNDDYQLTNINNNKDKIKDYNDKFNDFYKEKIKKTIENSYIEFNITNDNYMTHYLGLDVIKELYNGFKLIFNFHHDINDSKTECFMTKMKIKNISGLCKKLLYNVYEDKMTLYKHPFELIRLGRNSDGGYIVPKELIKDELISCGINDEVSFESDYIKHNENAKIYSYDGSINEFPIENHKNIIWEKLNIDKNDSKNTISLNTIFEKFNLIDKKSVMLKIDIEGAEYNSFKDFKYMNCISCLVIEIHNILKDQVKFEELMSYINKTHTLIHKHDNNCGGYFKYCNITYANCYELTFVNNNFIDKKEVNYIKLPIKNLDFVNG